MVVTVAKTMLAKYNITNDNTGDFIIPSVANCLKILSTEFPKE